MEMHCAVARLAIIHTHIITDVRARYLKENIEGASLKLIKVKMTSVQLPWAGHLHVTHRLRGSFFK
jgi:hypothetical protein